MWGRDRKRLRVQRGLIWASLLSSSNSLLLSSSFKQLLKQYRHKNRQHSARGVAFWLWKETNPQNSRSKSREEIARWGLWLFVCPPPTHPHSLLWNRDLLLILLLLLLSFPLLWSPYASLPTGSDMSEGKRRGKARSFFEQLLLPLCHISLLMSAVSSLIWLNGSYGVTTHKQNTTELIRSLCVQSKGSVSMKAEKYSWMFLAQFWHSSCLRWWYTKIS